MKKVVIKLFIGIVLYIILSTSFKHYKNITVSDTCFLETYNATFMNITTPPLNSVYNFDDIFECGDWDEIFIVEAYYSRDIGYIKSGILIPKDQGIISEDASRVYFLKNNYLVSPQVILYFKNFLLVDFNNYHYLKVNREDAIFKCVELETIGFDYPIYSFELMNSN